MPFLDKPHALAPVQSEVCSAIHKHHWLARHEDALQLVVVDLPPQRHLSYFVCCSKHLTKFNVQMTDSLRHQLLVMMQLLLW